MFFKKKPKDHIKKIDVLITGLVLGTIIAGAFGLKKKDMQPPLPWWKKILNKILGKK